MTDWVPVGQSVRQAPYTHHRRRRRLLSRVRDRDSPLRHLDGVLVVAVLMLSVLGCLLVWSATRQRAIDTGTDPQAYLKKDLFNLVLGLTLATATALIDYRTLRAYAPVLYGGSLLGLLAVLTPLGSTINGAHSWIVLGGGFELQPAEFAKIALIVGMAMLLGERRDNELAPRDTDVLAVLGLAAVPMFLIMLQPDFGTTMVFVAIILGVLAVAGAPARWVWGLIVVGVVFVTLVLSLHLLKPYQEARLTNFAHPNAATSSTGYNVDQAKTAIGSGGLLGKGLFHGTQTAGNFVPEQQTDFVFTVAGEELGFVGSGLIVGLVGVVLFRGWWIARGAADLFGRIVGAGVVTWFGFQAFINIGMTLGIMPVTGLPLPFVSYGGSATFVNMIAIGLLLNVHRGARRG
jgi:rod shape determining protein RodA